MRRYVCRGSNGPRKYEIETSVTPRRPGPGEAVVKVHAVSFNYRDTLIIDGVYGGSFLPDVIPLSDGAGEVIAVGEGVTNVKVGDRVVSAFFADWSDGRPTPQRTVRALGGSAHGMFGEEVVQPACALLPAPDYMSFEEAATLPCAAVTAWNALVEIGEIRAGDTVLVQGTGGVSIVALQIAKMFGARVIATSSSDAKLAQAKQLGADHLINYHDTPDWDVAVRDATDGEGADIIIEVGGAGTLEKSLRAGRMGGTVATIGLVSGFGAINPLPLIGNATRLVGVFVGSHQMYHDMCKAMAVAKLRPVISERYAFDDVPAAIARFRDGVFGKMVVTLP